MESAEEKFSDYLEQQLIEIKKELTHSLWEKVVEDRGSDALFADEKTVSTIMTGLKKNDDISFLIHKAAYIEEVTSYIKRLISEKNVENKIVIDNFNLVSVFLLDSPLKVVEALTVLIDLVSLNIDKGVLEAQETVVITPSVARENGINAKTLLELSKEENINNLLNTEDEKLSEKQITLKNTLMLVVEQSKGLKSTQFINDHRVIENCYLKKRNCFQSDDIDQVITSLESLGVHHYLCQKINAILKKELSKRLKKQEQNIPIVRKTLPTTKKHYISDSEYKKIKKELGSYIDLYTMKVKKELTEEERLYCAHLLLKIDTKPGLVKAFFDRTEKEPDMENPIGFYNYMYDKLKFYEEKLDLTEQLDDIQSYLGECFIIDSESYQYWKDGIKDELSKAIDKIPRTYEYEFKQATNYQERPVQKQKR